MRRGTAYRRWMGWMALFAVWLTALAPTVSRSIPTLFAAPAVHTGMGAMAGMPGMQDMPGMEGMASHAAVAEAAPHGTHGGMADMDGDAACGYCTLFAQVPALGGVLYVPDVLPLPERVAAPSPPGHTRPAVSRRFAPTRGPPVVLSA